MVKASRRQGRESALQVLYQMEPVPDDGWSPQEALEGYFTHFDHPEQVQRHVRELVEGVAAHRVEIDGHISRCSRRWRLERMAAVDRSLLRLATYEILYCRDIPVSVIINEAIEIARRFGTERSAAFVNGILDAVAKIRDEKPSDD